MKRYQQSNNPSAKIEPGIIKIFRIYALIRFFLGVGISIFILTLKNGETTNLDEFDKIRVKGFKIPDFFVNDPNLYITIIISIGLSIVLFLYLNSSFINNKIKHAYLPIGLLIAVGILIFEKQFFSPMNFIWQQSVFIYSLLIITAWQYSYKVVLISTFTYSGLNLLLEIIKFNNIPIDITNPEFQRTLFRFGEVLPEFISMLFIGLVINRLIGSQRQHRTQLTQAYQELEQTNQTIEQLTIARERTRLSRELHDILAHTLSGLSVQLQAILVALDLNNGKAKPMVESAISTTEVGLKETREALKNLRPSFINDLGLAYAIKTKAENIATQNNWNLQLTLPKNKLDLHEDVESTFYRIFQESLTNIIKHANTNHVAIALNRINNKLILNITDNGIGFDYSQIIEGFGIKGMRERANLINASLEINSELNKGTTVTLVWENKK